MSILVTYATAKGSTGEIAERITSRLKAFVSPIDCIPIKEVEAAALPSYSAIIVGSAIRMGGWLSPANRFIRNNEQTLKTKPVWAFSVGMPPKESDRLNEERMVEEKIRKHVPDLQDHKLFQGRLYKQDLGWFLGMIFTCCVPRSMTKFGDERNWNEIEAWADKVGKEIRSGGPTGTD